MTGGGVDYWPPIITGLAGLFGALIGGAASFLGVRYTAAATDRRAREALRAAKGEELVVLLCAASSWFNEYEKSALDKDKLMATVPPEPYRAEAITRAYFPNLAEATATMVMTSVEYRQRVIEIRRRVLSGATDDLWSPDTLKSHSTMRDAAYTLRDGVLVELRKMEGVKG